MDASGISAAEENDGILDTLFYEFLTEAIIVSFELDQKNLI